MDCIVHVVAKSRIRLTTFPFTRQINRRKKKSITCMHRKTHLPMQIDVKTLPLSWEDLVEEGMATDSSFLV